MSGYLVWADADGHLQRSEVPEHSLTIGSFATCGAVIEHEAVGPVHVALERDAVGCRLRRLSRTRPVTVNGRAANEKGLQNGDRIHLGDYEARYAAAELLAPRELVLTFSRDDSEWPVEVNVPLSISVVGRIEGEILVDDPGVSSRHLEIENFGPDFCLVRDLGSTNGSELNGKAMGRMRHPLKKGDVIAMGRVRITVGFGAEPSKQAASAPQRSVVFVSESQMA
jgi:pSer/pThr/pTyr-binding forkhead associated (FHA) protein